MCFENWPGLRHITKRRNGQNSRPPYDLDIPGPDLNYLAYIEVHKHAKYMKTLLL